MVGAQFVRADLHVHTFSDSELDPVPDLQAYVDAAIASGIGVMAITDHSRAPFVREAVRLADEKPLLVVPGIEISTHDGHLLALFAPDEINALEELAAPRNL